MSRIPYMKPVTKFEAVEATKAKQIASRSNSTALTNHDGMSAGGM